MRVRFSRHTVAALAFLAAAPAFAYWTPIQVNLAGPAGLPPLAESVYGVRANILLGTCQDVWFLDAGVFNRVTSGAYGIRAGAVNWSDGEAYGLTVGAFNFDRDNAGLTAGAFNYAKKGTGVQIGIINVAENFRGVQIGALNFQMNSIIPIFPLFNMGSGSEER